MRTTADLIKSAAVEETTTTVGTGAYLLNGPTAGYFAFRDAYSDGDSVTYRVWDGPNVEVVTGVFNATANTLSRGTVLVSSNSDNLINWSNNTRRLIRPVRLPPFGCGAVSLEGDGFGFGFPTMVDSPVFSLSFWVYLTGSQILNIAAYGGYPPPTGDLFTKNVAYILNDPGSDTGETFISIGGALCSATFDIVNVSRANPAVITTSIPHGITAGSYFLLWNAGYANGTAGSNFPSPTIFGVNALKAVSVTANTITTNWNTSAAPNPWVTPTDTGHPGAFARYQIYNSLQLFLSNAAGNFVQWISGTRIPSDQWVNVLISCDTGHASGNKIINVFFGDTQINPSSTTIDASGAFNIQFGEAQSSGNSWNIFGTYGNPGVGGCIAYVAEAWFAAGQFVDFTDPAERAKFHTVANRPVSLGNNGSVPTGIAPTFYLHLDPAVIDPIDFFTGPLIFGDYVGNGGMELSPTSPCSP